MRRFKQRTAALGLALVLALSLNVWAFASNYTDMPDNWSAPALEAAVDNGLMSGDGSGRLNPEELLTRAELAVVVTRAFGGAAAADLSSYTDLSPSAWYFTQIGQAVQMGVLGGDGNVMDPDGPVTRQEAFAALARALDLDDGEAAALSAFEDGDSVADWALGPVAAMVSAGYVDGVGGKLEPTAGITRAQFAQVMYNTFAFYIREPGEVTEVPQGNVIINVPGVTLKNVTVTGDLIIGDGVGDGEARLDNVKVEGTVIVRGGGENSVYFQDCELVLIKVAKPFGGEVMPLRLVFLGSTSSTVRVLVVSLNSNVKLEGVIGSITIEGPYALVTISGIVQIVTVNGEGATIHNNGSIGRLNAYQNTTVTGNGSVDRFVGDGKVTDGKGNDLRPVATPEPAERNDRPAASAAPSAEPSESTQPSESVEPSPEITPVPTPEPTPEPTQTTSPSPEPTEEHTHTFGKWSTVTEATCTNAGEQVRTCTECGESETKDIPTTGHSFSGWTVTKQPTCEGKGEETGTCQNAGCGATTTRSISALGHDWSADPDNTGSASCTDPGISPRYICTRCGAAQGGVQSPALGHNFVDGYCTRCGTPEGQSQSEQ